MKNIAVILAAGNGERFGKKKQFINFIDKPLYRHVFDTVLDILPRDNIVIVGVDIKGGNTRSQSVIAGLEYFSKNKNDIDKVIILEAARPLVTKQQVLKLLNSESLSTTFVMPLVDTVIERDGKYVDRENYYNLLTPQCFSYKLLLDAYNKYPNKSYTDETRLMYEVYGIKAKFIKEGQNLFKLTYVRDLPILEHLFKLQNTGVLNV